MFVDKRQGLRECTGLVEQISNLREHGRCRFSSSDKLFEFASFVTLEPFERERPQYSRAATQTIAAQCQFVEVVAAPILQVVEDLEAHAQMFCEPRDRF